MPTPKLTAEIITAAIEGFESQKRRIDGQIAELRAMLPGGSMETAAPTEAPAKKRKKFSVAARKRMKEAQQRRWAKIRGESVPSAPDKPKPPKRKMSAERKAALVANLAKARAARAAKAKATANIGAPARKKTTAKKAPVKNTAAKKKTAPATGQKTATTA